MPAREIVRLWRMSDCARGIIGHHVRVHGRRIAIRVRLDGRVKPASVDPDNVICDEQVSDFADNASGL